MDDLFRRTVLQVKKSGLTRTIFTIGHSTRQIDEFVKLLISNGIDLVADVRTVPRSRHNPQFNKDSLPDTLAEYAIGYRHIEALGGLRSTNKSSLNTAWRNASFRGFADHMQSPEFAAGIDTLVSLADNSSVCLMCAEAVPWRCHRSLIADAMLVRGFEVRDIIGAADPTLHKLTPFAVVEQLRITYPGTAPDRSSETS